MVEAGICITAPFCFPLLPFTVLRTPFKRSPFVYVCVWGGGGIAVSLKSAAQHTHKREERGKEKVALLSHHENSNDNHPRRV
jgi:hypothetical protein